MRSFVICLYGILRNSGVKNKKYSCVHDIQLFFNFKCWVECTKNVLANYCVT